MQKFRILVTLTFIFLVSLFTFNEVEAVTFENPLYEVKIDIADDSTFIVKEKIINKAYGEFHGLRRDITLENSRLQQFCLNNPSSTCGGFDLLVPLAVYDKNGNKLNPDQYKFYEVEDEDTGDRFARFEWELFADGKNVNGEEFGWIVEYKIFGGIEWIQDSPYFYWNTIPEDRSGITSVANITINFPNNAEENRLTLFDNYANESTRINGNRFTANLRNIGSRGNYTVAYQFRNNEITKPAILDYRIENPHFGNEIYLDGVKIESSSSDILDYIPAGTHQIKFTHFGYEDYASTINFVSEQTTEINVNLTPTPVMSLMLFLNTIILIFGLCLIPFTFIFLIWYYNRNGRDKNMPKTIIPLFSPPEGVRPYLLGSLKDETVDRVDVIGTIIDLAYRGYIKIKEITPKKNYQLIKLEGKKDDPGLNENEKIIYDSLFGSKEEVETDDLKYSFPAKYYKIEKNIYRELVSKGYFNKSPQTVRGSYLGLGIFLMSISLFLFIFPLIFLTGVIGYLVIFTPAVALGILGFGFIILAKFMPAKTELGSKVFAEILGFKMYLHTAERYRLQNLGPDEFERYLSYAIVFGIEKEWAKKFEGIYNKVPDWYEGSYTGVWDAIWISSLARSFADSTSTNFSPASSGSGSGWSGGGGSFGGFSGGGGGGGSSGGW